MFSKKSVYLVGKKLALILKTAKSQKEINDQIKHFPNLVKFLKKENIKFSSQAKLKKIENEKEFFVWLSVTDKCNFACRYCYIKKSPNFMSNKMLKSIVKNVFHSARLFKMKKATIKISGGEPLICFKKIKLIFNLVNNYKKNIKTRIILLTNLSLLNEKMAEQIRAMNLHLVVSLDGIQKYNDKNRIFLNGKGTYNCVIKKLKILKKYKINFNVNLTLSNFNIVGLNEIICFLNKEGILFHLSFCRPHSLVNDKDELVFKIKKFSKYYKLAIKKLLLHQPKDPQLDNLLDKVKLSYPHFNACGIAKNYLVYGANGKLYLCHCDMQKSIGNYTCTNPLKQVQRFSKKLKFLDLKDKKVCQKCFWKYYCAGGCYKISVQEDNYKNPFCSIYKKFIPLLIKYEALRILKYENN